MLNYIFQGAAIRTKTLKFLAKEFATVTDAENFYDIDYFSSKSILVHQQGVPSSSTGCPTRDVNEKTLHTSIPRPHLSPESLKSQGNIVKELISSFKYKLTNRMQEQLINHLLQNLVLQQYGTDLFEYISKDFLHLAVKGMNLLKQNNKENLFLAMAKCFGEEIDGEPRMPVNQMPFGLISYNLQFFACNNTANIKMDNDYLEWQTTMYAQFGHKWACLHRGPAWQFDEDASSESEPEDNFTVLADNGSTESTHCNSLCENSSVETGTSYVQADEGTNNSDLIQVALDDCEINLQEEQNETDMVTDLDISELTKAVSQVDLTPCEYHCAAICQNEISSLWSSNVAERNEELTFTVDKPEDVEKYFKVRPTRSKRKINRHIYCPYKVQ